MFYLESREEKFDHVGRAVSSDLIHWSELPSIKTKGEKGMWNAWGTLTGTTVHRDGLFYLFVGSIPDEKEVIGIWTSPDLVEWSELPENPIIEPCLPYVVERADSPYWPVDLRDPSIIWDSSGQCYHAVVCTRTSGFSADDTHAALGHFVSKDLIKWTAREPFCEVGRHFFHCEVPDLFRIGDWWYLTFNSLSLGGIRINTAQREGVTGMFYAQSKSLSDEFVLSPNPFLIGREKSGDCCVYSARTIQYGDFRVLYHHINAERPIWGSPKVVIQSGDTGQLSLMYFAGLAGLETAVLVDESNLELFSDTNDLGRWVHSGSRVSASAGAIGSSRRILNNSSDVHLSFELSRITAARAGVVFRGGDLNGVGVIFDFELDRLDICLATAPKIIRNSIGIFGSWHFASRDGLKIDGNREGDFHLRVLVRSEHFEVYVNDVWMLTNNFPEVENCGGIDLYVERGSVEFSKVRIACLEGLPV